MELNQQAWAGFLQHHWELSSFVTVSQMEGLCGLGGEHLPEAGVGGP